MKLRSLVHASVALPLVLFGASCASSSFAYRVKLDEFDSVSRRPKNQVEPDTLEYQDHPDRLPWFVRQLGWGTGIFGGAEPDEDVENPSGFARGVLEDLVSHVDEDVRRAGQLLPRFLWVLEEDDNALNRLVALRGIERICAELGFNLLAADVQDIDASAERRREVEKASRILNIAWPTARGKRDLTAAGRKALVDAIAAEVARPLTSGRTRRMVALRMHNGLMFETDKPILDAMAKALHRALHIAATIGLRDALASKAPEVRREALRVLRRRAGAEGIAYALYWKSRYQALALGNPYDPDPSVRLVLIRLCGQLRMANAEASYRGGKTPLDFLFETGVNENESEGLRQPALEGLARCLGRRRSSRDPSWAREWRMQYISSRAK